MKTALGTTKKLSIVFATLLACCLLLYLLIKQGQSSAAAFRAVCSSIANDLLANTNSERVSVIDHWSATNFSSFLAVQAKLEAVKLGDEPSDFVRNVFDRQAHATARLYFTNQRNKHFQIRIRAVNSPTNYTVIGAGWD